MKSTPTRTQRIGGTPRNNLSGSGRRLILTAAVTTLKSNSLAPIKKILHGFFKGKYRRQRQVPRIPGLEVACAECMGPGVWATHPLTGGTMGYGPSTDEVG